MTDLRDTDPMLHIGDTCRFSVELIRQIDQMPDRSTVIVRVVKIETGTDGHKTVFVENVEVQP